jgi:hypothetical protein
MHKGFSVTATGPQATVDAGSGRKFRSLAIRVLGAGDCTVDLETSNDGTTWVRAVTAKGLRWENAASDVAAQYVRANVTSLGAGSYVSANISGYATQPLAGPAEEVPPQGTLATAPSATAYNWVMDAGAVFNPPTITAVSLFGHADASATPGTTLDITGNDGGVIAASGYGDIIVISDQDNLNLSVSDSTTQSWGIGKQTGGNGVFIYRGLQWITHAHVATDVITVTSDAPAKMLGAVLQVTEPGSSFGSGNCNFGYGKQAYVYSVSSGAQCTPVVASPDLLPEDPAPADLTGVQNVAKISGADLYLTASWGVRA